MYLAIWVMGWMGDWDGYHRSLNEDLPIEKVKKALHVAGV